MGYWRAKGTSQSVTTDWTTWEFTGIPRNCTLSQVVLLLTDITDAAKVTLFISHDDDGIEGIVPFTTSGATQTINDRDASGSGFVAIALCAVWYSEDGENPRLHCKVDDGSATVTPRLYAVMGGA